jgi:hypothetical protein
MSLEMVRDAYRQNAAEARAIGDGLGADDPANRYAIAVLEGWALSMDLCAMAPDPETHLLTELQRDGQRRKRLAWLYGATP